MKPSDETPQDRAEIEAALERLLDGEPEPTDGPLLARAMRIDPALRREVSGLLAVDELLRQNAEFASGDFTAAVRERITSGDDGAFVRRLQDSLPGNGQRPPRPTHRPGGRRRIALVAAVGLVCVFAGIAWFASRPAGAPQPDVATLLLAENCEWSQSNSVEEGNRLTAGTLGLRRGLAIVRFDGGAELILRDDTEVELLTAARARLLRGEVTVRAPEEAAGFKLLTPAGEVIDLGTEFAAKAERSGATELHVLEGEVAFSATAAAPQAGDVLHAGKAIRFDDSTVQTPREVELRADRFAEIIRAAHPASRADLMSAYEGFSYPAGKNPFADARGGLGWRGPWRAASSAEAYRPAEDAVTALSIAAGDAGANWTPVVEKTAGGGPPAALELPVGTTTLVRPLARPIELAHDGVLYFSCVVREPDSEAGLIDRRFGGVRFVLRSSQNPDEMLSFGPSRIRRPGIRLGSGANFASPLQIARNQTTLWVGKIVARRSGDDEIFFSVYGEQDLPSYAEPAFWQVASRGIRRNAALDLVLIAGQLGSPTTLDEIRIGPTWRSVAPIGPTFDTARP